MEISKHIIQGLNDAGFSDKDYRVSEPPTPKAPDPVQITIDNGCSKKETPLESPEEDVSGVDWKLVNEEYQRRREAEKSPETTPKADSMLSEAESAGQAYNAAIQQSGNDPYLQKKPWEVREQMPTFAVKPEFREDIERLVIPQFFAAIPNTLFTDGSHVLLDEAQLSEGFTLKNKDCNIDFAAADGGIVKVDIENKENSLPRVFKMSSPEQQYFKEYFNSLPPESRVRQCKEIMLRQLNKLNGVDAAELKAYIERIVGNMSKDQLAAMEKAPLGYAKKIKDKVHPVRAALPGELLRLALHRTHCMLAVLSSARRNSSRCAYGHLREIAVSGRGRRYEQAGTKADYGIDRLAECALVAQKHFPSGLLYQRLYQSLS